MKIDYEKIFDEKLKPERARRMELVFRDFLINHKSLILSLEKYNFEIEDKTFNIKFSFQFHKEK